MISTIKDTSTPLRIAFLGPESSGKTTLINTLAPLLDAFIVPEYFRFYWAAKCHTKDHAVWQEDEFLHLTAEQNRFEDLYAQRAPNILLCDTSAWQIAVWHYRYLGRHSARLLKLAQARTYHLIFLCKPDIPFVQDGVRDGKKIRESMFTWLSDLLVQENLTFVVLDGDADKRRDLALKSIQGLR